MKKKLYANAYYKDDEGAWRYESSRRPVPGAYTGQNGEMCAPELMFTQLLDAKQLAELLDVQVGTLRVMKARKELPLPQFVSGRTCFWSREIIKYWVAQRPRASVSLAKKHANE